MKDSNPRNAESCPSTDEAWLSQAFREFELPLMGYAAHLLGDRDRAGDVVQETFVRLCRQPRDQVIHNLRAWLYRVCRNQALDILRKEKRMTTLDESNGSLPDRREPTPDEPMETRESSRKASELISQLPEQQQEVIRLKVHGGMSYREIAELTGLSVSNVGYLLSTGLKTVRTRLAAVE